MADNLQAQALDASPGDFNWIYLIEYITCGVLSLFFLFYFNRLFGTVVSYAIRLYSWHAYRIYLDIGALQISLLAGRIFFKDIRYHGDNETIFIHAGYLTWQYWLRKTKECQCFQSSDPKVGTKQNGTKEDDERTAEDAGRRKAAHLPCRISVNVSGVEAFLYNRSPSYDFILDNLRRSNEKDNAAGQKEASDSDAEKNIAGLRRPASFRARASSQKDINANTDNRSSTSDSSETGLNVSDDLPNPAPPFFLRILPIRVKANTISAVLGNANTKTIITAKIASAEGEFDAGNAGPLDYFKILIDFDVQHPVVKMLPNEDYKDTQLAEAAEVKSAPVLDPAVLNRRGRWGQKVHGLQNSLGLHKFWRSLESIALHSDAQDTDNGYGRKRLDVPGAGKWEGLSRYLNASGDDEHGEWDPVEYAKISTLVDLERVNFRFYWDIPGKVADSEAIDEGEPAKGTCDINGTVPPEYGMEIRVYGGHVNYGPWADRHRLALQQAFFPASFTDAVPTLRLRRGDDRLCTIFNIFVSIEAETVVRIPFREPSKDWRWYGKSATYKTSHQDGDANKTQKAKPRKKNDPDYRSAGADLRPFAWFDIVVKGDSSIAYTMDMFPRSYGYGNELRVDVSGIDIFSSLNHALMWKSGRVALKCDLSYPLSWRAIRNWVFTVDIFDLEFLLLRDHTFLLVDLIDDWSRGPKPDFYTFVPFRYLLNANMHNFQLLLNVNDGNIINNSADMEDNDFVILFGRKIESQLTIPLYQLNPSQSDITFNVLALDLGFEIRVPTKNTLNELLVNKKVATIPKVTVNGVYNMRTETSPSVVDTLNLDIVGDGLVIEFYGFFARQLVKVKENYFGEDVHFRTLEEYQLSHDKGDGSLNTLQPPTSANDLDVILNIVAHDGKIMLPAGLYDSKEHIFLQLHTAHVDLRVNNYLLELMVNSLPLSMGCVYRLGDRLEEFASTEGELTIDGVSVYGHRLFGLPPSELAYVSNWDIDVGDIISRCSNHFLAKTVSAAQCLTLTVEDKENAMPMPLLPLLHDVTYVRFSCPQVSLHITVEDVAFVCAIRAVQGSFNDCAGRHFSQTLEMNVPEITVACVEDLASNSDNNSKAVSETYAYLSTAVNLTMLQRSVAFNENRQKQQEFVAVNDRRSQRAKFLYPNIPLEIFSSAYDPRGNVLPPLDLASLPQPVTRDKTLKGLTVDLKESIQEASADIRLRAEQSRVYNRPQAYDNLQDRRDSRLQAFQHAALTLPTVFERQRDIIDKTRFDLSQVPMLSSQDTCKHGRGGPESDPDIMFNPELTDDATHVSLIFDIEPGISALARPKAVHAVGNLIDQLLPKHPDQVMDDYSVQTLTEVLASYNKKHGKNDILDVGLHLPQLRLRFINDAIDKSADTRTDQWDLDLTKVDLLLRQKIVPQRKDEADSISVHTTVSSIRVSAQTAYSGTDCIKKDFETSIEDVLLWLVDGERTSVHTSFRAINAAIESEKMDHLAHIIHKTTLLAESLQTHFSSVFDNRLQRRRQLIYLLTKLGEESGDPTFLNRPAYASRHSAEQLRNSDSWKIMSHLRHILLHLDETSRHSFLCDYYDSESLSAADAENYVVAKLDTWRSWDAIRVRDSFAVRILFSSMDGIQKLNDRSTIPLGIHARTQGIRLVVDPGQDENSFHLDSLVFGVTVEPPPLETAMQIFHEHSGSKSTVVQLNTSNLGLHVNWRLFELADRLLGLFSAGSTQDDSAALIAEPNTRRLSETFHAVFVAETGTVCIDTINLSHKFWSDALKVSATGAVSSGEDNERFDINVMACANKTSIDALSGQKSIYHAEANLPRFWVCFEREASSQRIADRLQIAADSRKAVLQTIEDISGLLEVTNAVVSEEAAQISGLVAKYARPPSPNTTFTKQSLAVQSLSVNVALFLGEFLIEVAILPELHYRATGDVVRFSLAPDSQIPNSFRADFDLKSQRHELLIFHRQGPPKSASLITLPAINGSLVAIPAQDLTTISASVSMEDVLLDGSAVYGLLNTVINKRMSDAFDAIVSDGKSLAETIADHFPQTRQDKTAKEQNNSAKKPVIFEINTTLAGFAVAAQAPFEASPDAQAKLSLFSGPIQARISNRPPGEGGPLVFPDCRIVMEHAGLGLTKMADSHKKNIGSAKVAVIFTCTNTLLESGTARRDFELSILGPQIQISADTAPAAAEIVSHIQHRLQGLELRSDTHSFRRLRRIVPQKNIGDATIGSQKVQNSPLDGSPVADDLDIISTFTFNLAQPSLRYMVDDMPSSTSQGSARDLVFSIESLKLNSLSSREARMRITALQLRMAPRDGDVAKRPINSATLPEMVFHVVHESNRTDRKLFFRARGKAVEVLLDSRFILPVSRLEKSISGSVERTKLALSTIKIKEMSGGLPSKDAMGTKKLKALVMDVTFAGAVICLQSQASQKDSSQDASKLKNGSSGRYGQFSSSEGPAQAVLRAPGVGAKVEFRDDAQKDPFLNVEIRIDGSNNTFAPSVVPVVLDMARTIQQVVNEEETVQPKPAAVDVSASRLIDDEAIVQADPRAILGKTRLNIGFRICKQSFSLSCHPIAKIAASASIEDIYITVNNIDSSEQGHFFSGSAAFYGLKLSLKHDYSQKPTFGFDMQSVFLSVMNSKHFSGTPGISAILRVQPTKTHVNAKSLQDILLFREVWLPAEIRNAAMSSMPASADQAASSEYFVHRYHQLAATKAFKWNATIAIAELGIELDLGQAIGNVSFGISNLWASSRKSSSSRQSLCIGTDNVYMHSNGRMSGIVELHKVQIQTSIEWPTDVAEYETPRIQGSISFAQIRVKASFDYQVFAIAHITSFELIMYNTQDEQKAATDRLVAILDGDKVHVYCIAVSAALAYSLFQAFERLIIEQQDLYERSLQDVEKYLKRRVSTHSPLVAETKPTERHTTPPTPPPPVSSLKLQTNVVVSLRSIDIGAFPTTLFDSQLLRLTASETQAKFAVSDDHGRVSTSLGLELGRVNAALANVLAPVVPKPLPDISIEEVVKAATTSSRGVILAVPRVLASMQTWQAANSYTIDYIFRSTFEGKIDVGWNYTRIGYIRGMWARHAKALSSRLGKPLPESALQIHGGPQVPEESANDEQAKTPTEGEEQQRLTAVVNLPLSRYTYMALEPPVIDTPQLRDMGDATPPLEWVGLHRDKLPNVTHQVIVVPLLEVAREVGEAYGRILGSS